MDNNKMSYTTLTIIVGVVFLVGVIIYALFFHEGEGTFQDGSQMPDAQVTLPTVDGATPDIQEVEPIAAEPND